MHSFSFFARSLRIVCCGMAGLLAASGCATFRPADPHTRVSIEGTRWLVNGRPVNAGSPAEGLLMNVRMVNAVFEDTGPAGAQHLGEFDPDENTEEFIRRIPEYVSQGVNAFTVSLQGGMPGYEGAVNSAFNADGSLREGYMERVARVIEAADRHGAVVILSALYQRQHSHERMLRGRAAVLSASAHMARWVASRGYENVVLEVANEYAHGGYGRWADGEWLRSDSAQVELIRHARAAAPELLVSTSGMGSGIFPREIAEAADFLLIHFNNTALDDIPARIEAARRYGKPVVVNEDDKIDWAGAEAARLSVKHGAGWGFMHSKRNQYVPFEFGGATDDPAVYHMVRQLTTPGASVDAAAPRHALVLITEPQDGRVVRPGSALRLRAMVALPEGARVREVLFRTKDGVVARAAASPWQTDWTAVPAGRHDLTAVVVGAEGNELARSRPVDIEARP